MAACTLVALVLSVRFATRSGLFRDEAQLLEVVAAVPLADLASFLRAHEWHPPLYYVLMHAWRGLFGPSDAAALALPVVCGLALVPALYRAGARMESPRVGMAAALLAGASPLLAEHAALARPYSLMPLLALGSVLTLWSAAAAGGRGRDWAAHAALAAAMLYTHNWAALVLAAEWIVFLFWWWSTGGAHRSRLIGRWLAAQAAVVLLYLPWLPSLLHQAAHGGHAGAPIRSWDPLATFVEIVTSVPNRSLAVVVFLATIAALVALPDEPAGSAAEAARRRLALLLLGGVPMVAFGLAVALSPWTNLALPRCYLIVAPGVLILIARALVRLGARVHRVAAILAGGGLLIVYALSVGPMLLTIKSNARDAAARVAAAVEPGDLIVISPAWLASSFDHYFRPGNPQLVFPEEGRRAVVTWEDLAERMADPRALQRARARIAEARLRGERVWFVMDVNDLRDSGSIPPEGLPGDDRLRRNWVALGTIRTSQLLAQVRNAYGPPVLAEVPGPGRFGTELLATLLFAPRPAPAGEPAR